MADEESRVLMTGALRGRTAIEQRGRALQPFRGQVRSERTLSDGTKLAWGFDATALGFFLEVRRSGRKLRCYDGLQPHYDRQRPVLGLLKFLVETEVVSEDDLDAVLIGEPDYDEDVPPSVRLVADILDDLRRAAGE